MTFFEGNDDGNINAVTDFVNASMFREQTPTGFAPRRMDGGEEERMKACRMVIFKKNWVTRLRNVHPLLCLILLLGIFANTEDVCAKCWKNSFGWKECNWETPKEDILREVHNALNSLLNVACAGTYKNAMFSIAGVCLVENSGDFQDIRAQNFLIANGFFAKGDFSDVTFPIG